MLHNFGAIIMSCWVTVISCLLAEELRLQRNIENYALLRRCFPGSNANGSSGGSSTKSSSTTSPLSSTKTGHKATDSSESNFIDRTEFLITKVSFEGFLTRYNIIKRVSHAITNNSVRKKSVNFFFLFKEKIDQCARKNHWILILQKAMEDLGFSDDEIHDIFRIISAVLKLGNLCFVPTTNMDGTEGCAISNDYGKTHHNPLCHLSLSFPFWFIGITTRQSVHKSNESIDIYLSSEKKTTTFLLLLFPTEVHDACHCLRTSYEKLIQVLLVRTIQWPSKTSTASASATEAGAAVSPSTG